MIYKSVEFSDLLRKSDYGKYVEDVDDLDNDVLKFLYFIVIAENLQCHFDDLFKQFKRILPFYRLKIEEVGFKIKELADKFKANPDNVKEYLDEVCELMKIDYLAVISEAFEKIKNYDTEKGSLNSFTEKEMNIISAEIRTGKRKRLGGPRKK